ncbi:MAG: hypothetical protein M1480_17470 [Bacteroidetes bacterium]|nr:hypothetical protein [Bacteroidota bacterium]
MKQILKQIILLIPIILIVLLLYGKILGWDYKNHLDWLNGFIVTVLSVIFVFIYKTIPRQFLLPHFKISKKIIRELQCEKIFYLIRVENETHLLFFPMDVFKVKVDSYLMNNNNKFKQFLWNNEKEGKKRMINFWPDYKENIRFYGHEHIDFYTNECLENLLSDDHTVLIFKVYGKHLWSGGEKEFSFEFDKSCIIE